MPRLCLHSSRKHLRLLVQCAGDRSMLSFNAFFTLFSLWSSHDEKEQTCLSCHGELHYKNNIYLTLTIKYNSTKGPSLMLHTFPYYLYNSALIVYFLTYFGQDKT